jgi:acyl carrier protein
VNPEQITVEGRHVASGEVVGRLLEHSAVAEAAVVSRPGTEGQPRLVGYVVARGTPPTIADLRRHVEDSLPASMVPAHWMLLDRLPRTPDGRLDHAALPEPATGAAVMDPAGSAEDDELTAALIDICREVLKVRDIGPDDDLFDLGGHSLSMTRIGNRINQRFGVTVRLDTFYDAPTVTELAAYLRPQLG